ncbi:MAG TPA: PHB depolymerase family esterase [Ktedonobacteraceae bacterium]|nr:PHB depolymerase family esterase [Ktedonobacteraceae bacterium]
MSKRIGWQGLPALALLVGLVACQSPEQGGVATPMPNPTARQNNYGGSIQVGGLTRTYLVHLPPGQNAPMPLVLVFHGGGGSSRGMNAVTRFNSLADAQGFIVVYPDGYDKSWADGRGTTAADRFGVNDVAFVSALIDQLAHTLSINARRIYAAGISNGGFFTLRLGCQLATKIAAIAVVAATMPANLAPTCHPARPVPAQFYHGSADPLVPAAGGSMTVGAGGDILSINDSVALWARLNGCQSAPATTMLPQSINDGTQVQRAAYAGCQQGADVVFFNIIDGGHTWPGGLQYLPVSVIGRTTRNLNATNVMWAFFEAHPWGTSSYDD